MRAANYDSWSRKQSYQTEWRVILHTVFNFIPSFVVCTLNVHASIAFLTSDRIESKTSCVRVEPKRVFDFTRIPRLPEMKRNIIIFSGWIVKVVVHDVWSIAKERSLTRCTWHPRSIFIGRTTDRICDRLCSLPNAFCSLLTSPQSNPIKVASPVLIAGAGFSSPSIFLSLSLSLGSLESSIFILRLHKPMSRLKYLS